MAILPTKDLSLSTSITTHLEYRALHSVCASTIADVTLEEVRAERLKKLVDRELGKNVTLGLAAQVLGGVERAK